MHFIYTLYAPCTRFVSTFIFSGGAQRRQPLTTHEKMKACGATAEQFRDITKMFANRSSVSHRLSFIGRQSERVKGGRVKAAGRRRGVGGQAERNAQWSGCDGGTAGAEQRRGRLPRSKARATRSVAKALRSGCMERRAQPAQWSHRNHGTARAAERGNENLCFSTPYLSVFQFGVLFMSGGKTPVILNGGFLSAKCLNHTPKCFHMFP